MSDPTQQPISYSLGPAPHPRRGSLIEELHSRPSSAVAAPVRLLHLAIVTGETTADIERQHLAELCRTAGLPDPAPGAVHFAAGHAGLQVSWERHTEFSTYSFIRPAGQGPCFAGTPGMGLPTGWLAALAGQTIASAWLEFMADNSPTPAPPELERMFARGNIVGGLASGGCARLWTDFDLDAFGCVRMLVQDLGMSPRQGGRLIQRLLEIQTYCMMALLALPLAREIGPAVSRMEHDLSEAAKSLPSAEGLDDAHALLKRLSTLAAEVEGLAARTPYRFGAARAYHALVLRRIEELREQRIEGQQTVGEFMDRRLAPAMRTCENMQRRIDSLSERVARASEMLRTRVDVTLAAQNRNLLESMDRRAKLQLQLQRTVEGLSVAAITYYGVGLLGYVTQALAEAGVPLRKEIVLGLAVPALAAAAWLGLRRLHRKLAGH